MKKRLRLIALIMVICVLFSGCAQTLVDYIMQQNAKSFPEFTYIRPDLQEFEDKLDECRNIIDDNDTLSDLIGCINEFYYLYDEFYTNYNLANIHYCCDMTDSYWSEEYTYCSESGATVEASLEEFYMLLADSQYREELEQDQYFGEGFFDYYTGETVWDPDYMALTGEEVRLQNAYYELYAQATAEESYSEEFYTDYCQQAAEIFVDLIAVRQEMAEYLGYDNYAEMMFSGYYDRDYSPEEAKTYLTSIGQELSGIYDEVFYDSVWNYGAEYCSEAQTFAYVENAAEIMGGDIQEAFSVLKDRQLYDIGYSENKYGACFSVFLDSYGVPFVFTSPWLMATDQLDFAHEFGHFTNDYICGGSYVSTDVGEVQSQGMEYMSLCCSDNTQLELYKMADSLDVYVAQGAYALFELEVYELTGEELTAENVQAVYERICADFNMDQDGWDGRDYVNIGHFYTDPMYIVSYVVSNDLAFQLYQMEKQSPGTGMDIYRTCLESQEYYILDFAQNCGLESPFAEGRLQEVRETFEEAFGS